MKSHQFLIVYLSAKLLYFNEKDTVKNNNMATTTWYVILVYHLDVWFRFSAYGIPVQIDKASNNSTWLLKLLVIWPLVISPLALSTFSNYGLRKEKINIIYKGSQNYEHHGGKIRTKSIIYTLSNYLLNNWKCILWNFKINHRKKRKNLNFYSFKTLISK